MNKYQTTPSHHDVAFIEQTKMLPGEVEVIERWVPAKKGEYAPMLFGPWDDKVPMKLEGRYINGKRI